MNLLNLMRSWIGNGTVDFMVGKWLKSYGYSAVCLLFLATNRGSRNLNPRWYKQLIKS